MILVDTSVWVNHLRVGDHRLAEALDADEVCTHPFVVGELACGTMRHRRTVLDLLQALPSSPVATDDEALRLIEAQSLTGRGLGYIDVHVLASAALGDRTLLWTRDKRLSAAAARLELAFR